MRVLLAVFGLVAFVWGTGNDVGEYIDGCFYRGEGEPIGCVNITVSDCDKEWLYQFSTPVQNGFNGVMIVDEGILNIGTNYTTCFHLQNNRCELCASFVFISYEETLLSTAISVSSDCSGIVESSSGLVLSQGVLCGMEGYLNVPCRVNDEREEYASSVPSASLVTLLEFYGNHLQYWDGNDAIFFAQENCVMVNGLDRRKYVLYCPIVLVDTCSPENQNMVFTSKAGITFSEEIVSLSADICFFIEGDECIRLCFSLEGEGYANRNFTGTTSAILSNLCDGGSVEQRIGFIYSYPLCGYSHNETCWIDYDPVFQSSSDISVSIYPQTTITQVLSSGGILYSTLDITQPAPDGNWVTIVSLLIFCILFSLCFLILCATYLFYRKQTKGTNSHSYELLNLDE